MSSSLFRTNTTIPDGDSAATVNLPPDKRSFAAARGELKDPVNLAPNQPLVFVATIVEINQQLHCYKLRMVGLDEMYGLPLDYAGTATGAATKVGSLFGVGTSVLAMHAPSLGPNYAVVLGSISSYLGPLNYFGSPELVAGSPVGSYRDKISAKAIMSPITNFNGGKPIDSYPGDTTLLSQFGCGLFISSLQASLRSSHECSVECHYIDSLLRLSTHNLEQFTAGAELQAFNDLGDYTEVKRLNAYVTESLGGINQYEPLPKADGKLRSSNPDPEDIVGKYKPEQEEQIGWWRSTSFDGYLGNVSLRYVAVPGLEATRTAGPGGSTEQDEYGVFREHIDSTGAYSVVSAKSISLIKDCFIPVPREQYRADDSRGDTKESITAARTANAANLLDPTIEGVNKPHGSTLYAAASSDMASARNNRSTIMFAERPNDWSLVELEDIDLAGFKSYIQNVGYIRARENVSDSVMFAKMPQVGKLKINAREEVSYYASRSMIMMHEDGSIHMQDGYGASISMRGGSIDITCPGDITLRPGRNMVSIAGDTVSHIAGVDVELAANKGDVRVQADRNIAIMGGNDGQGGILLESKAQGNILLQEDDSSFKDPTSNANPYRGIWLKGADSCVSILGKGTYIGNRSEEARIVVDCGTADFTVKGSKCLLNTQQTIVLTNVDNPDAGSNIIIADGLLYAKSSGGTLLESDSLQLTGPSAGSLQVVMDGAAIISNSVTSQFFNGLTTTVNPVDEDDLDRAISDIREALDETRGKLDEAIEAQAEVFEQLSNSVFGSPDTSLTNLTFCYPDSNLRGIPESAEYFLFESDWQSAYRTEGIGDYMVFRGVDPAVPAGAASDGVDNSKSFFWPGAGALSQKFGAMKFEQRLVDDKLRFKNTGFDKPISLVEAPGSIQDKYRVIRKNQLRTKQ